MQSYSTDSTPLLEDDMNLLRHNHFWVVVFRQVFRLDICTDCVHRSLTCIGCLASESKLLILCQILPQNDATVTSEMQCYVCESTPCNELLVSNSCKVCDGVVSESDVKKTDLPFRWVALSKFMV